MTKLKTEIEWNKKTLLKEGPYTSTKEILERIARIIPDRPILADLDKKKNIVYHTAADLLNDAEAIGEGLIDLGLEGKHIAICAENSYHYIMCDISISGGVGVVTPIDVNATNDLLVTLLNRCDADAVICSHHVVEKLEAIKKDIPNVKTIITVEKKVGDHPWLIDVMKKGAELAKKGYYRNKKLDLDAPAKILFTSGTTGANKGVVLTQKNLAANTMNCMNIKGPNVDNTSMSILPMHHATEINTHIFCRIAAGRLTYINDHMKNMLVNIKIFKPYVITIVPMIANAFYKAIWTNAKKAGKDEKLKMGIKLIKLMRKLGIDISHKLLTDVFAPFGGNLNQIVCGGAMLNPEVVKGFNDLGVIITNGYGITECGPLVSMNTDTLNEPYSIGTVCPGLEYKVVDKNEDGVGELCVKGKSVSLGYYKDPASTKAVFDADGFFHTGDLVREDSKHRLFIAGRKKNVIILENGKNVCPEEIETEVSNGIEYARECVAYMDQIGKDKLKQGICLGLYIEDPELRKNTEKIRQDFRELNKSLPTYKQINYINLVETEFEKTGSKKIKRDTIAKTHNPTSGIVL